MTLKDVQSMLSYSVFHFEIFEIYKNITQRNVKMIFFYLYTLPSFEKNNPKGTHKSRLKEAVLIYIYIYIENVFLGYFKLVNFPMAENGIVCCLKISKKAK